MIAVVGPPYHQDLVRSIHIMKMIDEDLCDSLMKMKIFLLPRKNFWICPNNTYNFYSRTNFELNKNLSIRLRYYKTRFINYELKFIPKFLNFSLASSNNSNDRKCNLHKFIGLLRNRFHIISYLINWIYNKFAGRYKMTKN